MKQYINDWKPITDSIESLASADRLMLDSIKSYQASSAGCFVGKKPAFLTGPNPDKEAIDRFHGNHEQQLVLQDRLTSRYIKKLFHESGDGELADMLALSHEASAIQQLLAERILFLNKDLNAYLMALDGLVRRGYLESKKQGVTSQELLHFSMLLSEQRRDILRFEEASLETMVVLLSHHRLVCPKCLRDEICEKKPKKPSDQFSN